MWRAVHWCLTLQGNIQTSKKSQNISLVIAARSYGIVKCNSTCVYDGRNRTSALQLLKYLMLESWNYSQNHALLAEFKQCSMLAFFLAMHFQLYNPLIVCCAVSLSSPLPRSHTVVWDSEQGALCFGHLLP